MPSFGPVDEDGDDATPPCVLGEEDWATVDMPWEEGTILLTLGTAWAEHELAAQRMPRVRSAVLHRVATSDGRPTRLSLPLLVDLVPRDSESL